MHAKILSLILCAAVATSGCGAAATCHDPAHAGDASCKAITPAADCLNTSIQPIIDLFVPVVRSLLKALTGADGTIDSATFEAQTYSLLGDYGQCAIAEVLGELFTSPPKLAPGEVSVRPDVARAEWEKLKATRYKGRSANTRHGVI